MIPVPDFSIVVLVGASGAGKSTFARKHFSETEIVSSDHCRALVSDDATNQKVSADAFDIAGVIADRRLKNRRLTVIDATNVSAADRKQWIHLAKIRHAPAVAIVLDPGLEVSAARNRMRPDRLFGADVLKRMITDIRQGLAGMKDEGFRRVTVLKSVEEIDAAVIVREKPAFDRRDLGGPFDIIGDVHGCGDELELLLAKLGYVLEWGADRSLKVTAPAGRKAVFVGDLVDRGPRTPDVLRVVMAMVEQGAALCVEGNHDNKFGRWLGGADVKTGHGLQMSIDQTEAEGPEFKARVKAFLSSLPNQYWLAGGKLCVAHAGLKEELIGRGSGVVRSFALYGETTGEHDEFGYPERADWAQHYSGATAVVYGHVAQPEAVWVNNTICIDTGCVFGGKLTALRWPERELVSVPATRTWFEPKRPLETRGR